VLLGSDEARRRLAITALRIHLLPPCMDDHFRRCEPTQRFTASTSKEDKKDEDLIDLRIVQGDMRRFCLTFYKDIIATLVLHHGSPNVHSSRSFNNCQPYSAWGLAGISLPEIHDFAELLTERINGLYPGIAFGCIGVQVCIIVGSLWVNIRALRVLLQNDDRNTLCPRWVGWPMHFHRSSFIGSHRLRYLNGRNGCSRFVLSTL
jgi:hypothetical protein